MKIDFDRPMRLRGHHRPVVLVQTLKNGFHWVCALEEKYNLSDYDDYPSLFAVNDEGIPFNREIGMAVENTPEIREVFLLFTTNVHGDLSCEVYNAAVRPINPDRVFAIRRITLEKGEGL